MSTITFDSAELVNLLDTLNLSQLRALVYQRINPAATKDAIADRFGMSVSAVEKALAFLRKNGLAPRPNGFLQKKATVNINDQVKEKKEPSPKAAIPVALAGDPLAQRLLAYGVRPRAVERVLAERQDRKRLDEQLAWHQHRLDNGFEWRPGSAPAALLTWLLVNPERDICPPGFHQARQAKPAPVEPEVAEPVKTDEQLAAEAAAEFEAMSPEARLQTVRDMIAVGQQFKHRAMVRRAYDLAETWGVPLELLEVDPDTEAEAS